MRHTSAEMSRTRSIFFLLLIAMACVAAYSNSFRAAFQFDDLRTIRFNFSLRDLTDIGYIAQAERFRPLLNATFALNYRLGKLDPVSYHAVNLLIHIFNVLLLYWFVRKISGNPAIGLIAALLMAVHPLNTEAVTYISSRSILLCSMFYLAGLLLFDSYLRKPRAGSAILMFLVYVAGCLTKEECALLPVTALLYNALFFGRDSVRHHRRFHIVSILLLVAGGMIRLVQVFHAGPLPYSISTYFATEMKVLWQYLWLAVYPVRLNVDPDIAPLTPANAAFWLFLLMHCAAIGALWRLRKCSAFLAFWGLWFWLNLLLSSSVFPLNDFMAEHRAYLSMMGYCACFSFCMIQLWKPRTSHMLVVPVALSLIVIFYAISTYQRNRVWSNELTLWLDAVEKSPQKIRPHLNLGGAYTQRQNYDLAIGEYRTVLAINPQTAMAYSGLGICRLNRGDLSQARIDFEQAVAIDPALADANVGLGMTWYRMKDYRQALQYLVPQYNRRQESLTVTGMIANSYMQTHKFEEAIPYLERFMLMRPDSATVRFDLLRSYIFAGKYDRAMEFYERNKNKFPAKSIRWNRLYEALEKNGRTEDARKLRE